ncbi:hypothetical protein P7C73_g2653, partial [Tremellales sp. Uapishka_1]
MSLKAELETWAAALKAYDAEDFNAALDEFERIADSSKIHWNIGIILATLGEHEQAVERFYTATGLDQYFTVAYQQAGVSNFMLGKYEAAHKDFEEALLYMRGNQTVNYEQLGLSFRLYSAEILFNVGLTKIYMGQMDAGLQDLREAQGQKQTPDHGVIDDAIRDQGRDYNVFSVPVGMLFKPSANKLKNLATRDYMGKAILVAASDANDAFTTFTGITRLQRGMTPMGAPLDVAHPLSRSASVSVLDKEAAPPPMIRSNTVATSQPRTAMAPLPRPQAPVRAMTVLRSAPAPQPRQPPAPPQTSGSDSPVEEPQLQTPQSRSKDLRITELYDDYYKSPGAFDDDIPELPPIGEKKIEAWAQRTPTGAPPARANTTRAPPTAFGRRPSVNTNLSRSQSIGSLSRYDDGESDTGSYYDMAKIRIKAHVGNHTRGMSVSPEHTYDHFIAALRAKFPEMSATMNVRFKDEDGDMLSMQDEGDYEAAVDVARVLAKGRAEGKLEIWVD